MRRALSEKRGVSLPQVKKEFIIRPQAGYKETDRNQASKVSQYSGTTRKRSNLLCKPKHILKQSQFHSSFHDPVVPETQRKNILGSMQILSYATLLKNKTNDLGYEAFSRLEDQKRRGTGLSAGSIPISGISQNTQREIFNASPSETKQGPKPIIKSRDPLTERTSFPSQSHRTQKEGSLTNKLSLSEVFHNTYSNPSYFFMKPIKENILKGLKKPERKDEPSSTNVSQTGKEKEQLLKPILRCTSMARQTQKNRQGYDYSEDEEMKTKKMSQFKHVKRYGLRDLELDDQFLEGTTLPYERMTACLKQLNEDYSMQSLGANRNELNVMMSQNFDTVTEAVECRELIYICYNMLLFDLLEEEYTFYNTLSLMLQSLEMVMLKPFEFDINLVCKKIFALLKKMIETLKSTQLIVLQIFYNSFTSLSKQAYLMSDDVIKDYFMAVLPFFETVISVEWSLCESGQHLLADTKHNLTPMAGFRDFLVLNLFRKMLVRDDELREAFLKLMDILNNQLLQVSFLKISGTKKQEFTTTWFAVFIDLLKYKSIKEMCEENIPGFNKEGLLKTVFSLIYVTCKNGSPHQSISLLLESILTNCCRLIDPTECPEEEKPIQDNEFFFKLYFKMHFDPDSNLVSEKNLDLCYHLALFVRALGKVSSKSLRKKIKMEVSSAIGLYNQLMISIKKLNSKTPEDNRTLKTLLELLNC